jgi:transketolase
LNLNEERLNYLQDLGKKFRLDIIELLHNIQTGHPGGSLSVCEILTVLYFEIANVEPSNPQMVERDRIILSKGHAAPMLYRVLAEKGFFPLEEMKTLRQLNTRLQGHPSVKDTPGIELSTGPLGIGLSASLGMALGLRLSNITSYVYAILGDGETNEGTVWEACMAAAKFKVDHLIAIIDHNNVQLDGTCDEIMPIGSLIEKFKAFGWNTLECDGHDFADLFNTISKAKNTTGKPTVIIANTIKGKGVSFMEGKNIWHGKPINGEEYTTAMAELKGED